MKNDILVIYDFKVSKTKVLILGFLGVACFYILNKKISEQTNEIKKLSEELKNQKGD